MSNGKPILVVMAAGMGSRYGGLKQIDPVGKNGEAILDYSLYDARRAGFKTVVFIIKHAIEDAFKQTVGARLEKSGMEIRYAYQELDHVPQGYSIPTERTKPWGTAHAVLCAWPVIDAPFAVINADDYYGPECFREMYRFLSENNETEQGVYRYAMVGFELRNTVSEHGSVSRGVCTVNSDGTLCKVEEHTNIVKKEDGIFYSTDKGETWHSISGDTVVSMNMWGFTQNLPREIESRFSSFLNGIKPGDIKAEYYLPSVVTELLEEKKACVTVLHSSDKWYGVTYAEDKPDVQKAISKMTEQGNYPEPVWQK